MNVNCTGSSDFLSPIRKPNMRAPTADVARKDLLDHAKPSSDSVRQPPAGEQSPVGAPGTYGTQDLESLIQSWGQSGTKSDLNGDGAVDVDDLIMLIQNWQQQSSPAEPTQANKPTEPSVAAIDPSAVDVAIETAPTTDPIIDDTAAKPASETTPLRNPKVDATPGDHGKPASPPDQVGPGKTPLGPFGEHDLEWLIKSWGQPGTQYDLDGDGAVDTDDLITLIQNWQQGPSSSANNPGNIGPVNADPLLAATDKPALAQGSAARTADSKIVTESRERRREADATETSRQRHSDTRRALSRESFDTLKASIIDRLSVSGFATRPPANLREIVDSLNLSPRDTRALLKDLKEAYPDGLGVNFRA